MAYLVILSFDIKDAKPENYPAVYAALSRMGFRKELTAISGEVCNLPSTTLAAFVEAVDASAACSRSHEAAAACFRSLYLKGTAFICSCGVNWAWQQETI